jgi:hypothetical protein
MIQLKSLEKQNIIKEGVKIKPLKEILKFGKT